MAKGKPEEYNPKRRPRKPTDPIPPEELWDELKRVFPGAIEINNEPEEPPTEYGEDEDMSYD